MCSDAGSERGTPRAITPLGLATSLHAATTRGDIPATPVGKLLATSITMSPTSLIREFERLAGDRRGTAFAEYLAAVGAFGLVVGAIMTTRAQSLVVDYASARDLLMLPAM